MSAIDTKRLCEKAAEYGMDLSAAAQQLAAYAQMLVEYNEKVNLTAITDAEGIEDRHFIDSLLLASQPEVQGSLVDVGTGAGFPGLPLRILEPSIRLTLLDALQKRITFLQGVCDDLGLDDVACVHGRAEEFAQAHRESFDLVTSRAVASLELLSELCLPYVKVGGQFLAMKAVDCEEEVSQAGRAVSVLGGRLLPMEWM